MNAPRRFRDLEAGEANEISDLLRRASSSRPMTRAERLRSATRVKRIATLPIAAGLWLWFVQGVAIAAGTAATVAAVEAYQARETNIHAPPPAVSAPLVRSVSTPRITSTSEVAMEEAQVPRDSALAVEPVHETMLPPLTVPTTKPRAIV